LLQAGIQGHSVFERDVFDEPGARQSREFCGRPD
jgi:hypothetical protein